MKNLLFVACLLFGIEAVADNRSTEVLERMALKMKAHSAYQADFKALYDNEDPVEGMYMVKGNKYYIKAGQAEVFSDGKTRWEANPENKEVTVDDINPGDKSILSNPTKAFEFLNGNFTHSYLGRKHIDGKECDVVLLKPVDERESFSGITLMVDTKERLPVRIGYEISGSNSELEIYLTSVLLGVDTDDSLFVFSKGRFKGYEIIDFR